MRGPTGAFLGASPKKVRLDQAVVQRGLAETRERAQSYVLSGFVAINGKTASRPAASVEPHDIIALRPPETSYVSRGAWKLVAGLDRWRIDVANLVCLDIGASTGGFTQVLLERGARKVYAVDAGTGQLHQRLRDDRRVVAMERTNVRYLTNLPEPAQVAVADVSFISLRLALPAVFPLLSREAPIIALVKPQFEAGREHVGRGGVVRDARVHLGVLEGLTTWSATQPWSLIAAAPSPIRGPAGNVEFVTLWRRGGAAAPAGELDRAVLDSAQLATEGR